MCCSLRDVGVVLVDRDVEIALHRHEVRESMKWGGLMRGTNEAVKLVVGV